MPIPKDDIHNYLTVNSHSVSPAKQELAKTIIKTVSGGYSYVTVEDPSLLNGTISGQAQHFQDLYKIWIEAHHSDIHTFLTTSYGNFQGQPLSFLLTEYKCKIPQLPGFSWIKYYISSQSIMYIGSRDLNHPHFILNKWAGAACSIFLWPTLIPSPSFSYYTAHVSV